MSTLGTSRQLVKSGLGTRRVESTPHKMKRYCSPVTKAQTFSASDASKFHINNGPILTKPMSKERSKLALSFDLSFVEKMSIIYRVMNVFVFPKEPDQKPVRPCRAAWKKKAMEFYQ